MSKHGQIKFTEALIKLMLCLVFLLGSASGTKRKKTERQPNGWNPEAAAFMYYNFRNT
jgi:hypothetical protein